MSARQPVLPVSGCAQDAPDQALAAIAPVEIIVTAYGTPKPKGSLKHIGNGRMAEQVALGADAAGSDVQRGLDMCAALCVDTSDMRIMVIPGEPASKARPRFTKAGQTYKSREDSTAEELTRTFLRSRFSKPLTGNVALGCIFFRPNRMRIDADNMLKHVCDAANGVVYLDDSQVTAVMGIVELDPTNPRTVVLIGTHATSMTRGTDATKPCDYCAAPIALPGRTTPPKYCSPECSRRSKPVSLVEPVPCQRCGTGFRRKTSGQKYCSVACSSAANRRPRPQRKPETKCVICGVPVSKPTYHRCRQCWLKARTAGEA